MTRSRFFLALSAIALCVGGCDTPPRRKDCAIVAVEKDRALQADARLRSVGVWSELLYVRFPDINRGHFYCVFQPRRCVLAYDITGTRELRTESHDPAVIAKEISRQTGAPIDSAHFLE